MFGGVWTCARDPIFDVLSLPLHPCVIALIIFGAVFFRGRGDAELDSVLTRLWILLSKTWLALCGFFFFCACLVRLAFQIDPSLVLNAVRYVWAAAGWLVFYLIWRAWSRGKIAVRARAPIPYVHWSIPVFVVLVLARPWVSSTDLVLSLPYKMVEWPLAFVTNLFASDECLADRVIKYSGERGLSEFVGGPAYLELMWRGKAAVPGIVKELYCSLDLDALSPGFVERNTGEYDPEVARDYVRRASSGVEFLLEQVGKYGGADPVLEVWSQRAPTAHLQKVATSALTCIRLGRQSLIGKGGANCALPGEYCEAGRCYKIFGEMCSRADECYSRTCENSVCCRGVGGPCSGTECCRGSECRAGTCARVEKDK